jgi:glutamate synthase (NADPH/NADH) small chain
MEAEGIQFTCNTDVGKNFAAEKLLKEFDATVLCTGATKPRDLPVEGRNLKGVHFAMEFLTANTRALLDQHRNGNFISAEGKHVMVIGGGDTGTDCVGTAMRHGCKSLVQIEFLPKPPLERADDNPWPQWPKVYKLDYGQEEAAAKFGDDPRVYLTTARVLKATNTAMSKPSTPCRWNGANDKGQFTQRSPGTEKVFPPTRPARDGFPRSGTAAARSAQSGVIRTNVAGFEKYHTNIRACLRRRLPPRPEPGGVGVQRRPRRRAQ